MHRTLRHPRLHSTPSRPRDARRLRAIFGGVAAAAILTSALGCDKRAEGEPPPQQQQTSLAGKPTALFLLFGERSDLRLLPLATIGHGRIRPITLDARGWRNFDQVYFKAGTPVSAYQDGNPLGGASIRRGMWDGSDPLYKLPGCRALRPLAAVNLPDAPGLTGNIELIATSDPLPPHAPRSGIDSADVDSARAVAARSASLGHLSASDLGELDLNARAIRTGATTHPTLVAAYVERGSGTMPNPRNLFLIADFSGTGYAPTFTHSGRDSVPELRRFIDHADITGDGIDEIVLDGWRVDGDSYLIVMQYVNGRWHEMARGANNWCADPPKQ